MNVVLAPDVFVNASVALGSPPDKVVQRVLGASPRPKTTPWILERVEAMLSQLPSFKKEAVQSQIGLIRKFVDVLPDKTPYAADAWEQALLGAAKLASAKRVITDHPDLVAANTGANEVDFVSTEEWLLEQALPPPPPPVKR